MLYIRKLLIILAAVYIMKLKRKLQFLLLFCMDRLLLSTHYIIIPFYIFSLYWLCTVVILWNSRWLQDTLICGQSFSAVLLIDLISRAGVACFMNKDRHIFNKTMNSQKPTKFWISVSVVFLFPDCTWCWEIGSAYESSWCMRLW